MATVEKAKGPAHKGAAKSGSAKSDGVHAGAPFIVKGHSYRAYDFDRAKALVDDALALQLEDEPTD